MVWSHGFVPLLALWFSYLLLFIGSKVRLAEAYHIPFHAALAVIVGGLLLSALVSLLYPISDTRVTATDDSQGKRSNL
jgi:hypothetical protein